MADVEMGVPEEVKQPRCDGAVAELFKHYPKP